MLECAAHAECLHRKNRWRASSRLQRADEERAHKSCSNLFETNCWWLHWRSALLEGEAEELIHIAVHPLTVAVSTLWCMVCLDVVEWELCKDKSSRTVGVLVPWGPHELRGMSAMAEEVA